MISPARGKRAPVQPVCTGVFDDLPGGVPHIASGATCDFSTAEYALRILMDCFAYCSSPVTAQMSASVYAAPASNCSALQPTSGAVFEPQQTSGTGLGVYVSEAHSSVPA